MLCGHDIPMLCFLVALSLMFRLLGVFKMCRVLCQTAIAVYSLSAYIFFLYGRCLSRSSSGSRASGPSHALLRLVAIILLQPNILDDGQVSHDLAAHDSHVPCALKDTTLPDPPQPPPNASKRRTVLAMSTWMSSLTTHRRMPLNGLASSAVLSSLLCSQLICTGAPSTLA